MDTAQEAIEHALDMWANQAAADFDKTMSTWKTHKSPVHIDKSANRRIVYVDNPIYSYLNFGTDVRRVLLVGGKSKHGVTSVGKTSPGVIGSATGRQVGRVISRSFQFPGIQARNFDEAIAERIYNEVLPRIADDLSDSLARIFVNTIPDTRTP